MTALESHRVEFLESLRVRSYSLATLDSYGRALAAFFSFLATRGVDDAREVNREAVRDYETWLAQREYATWSRIAYLQAVRRFFEHLERTDQVLINPCLGLLLPKVGQRLPRQILTREESCRILDAPNTQTKRGIRDKAILELFYSTGLRRLEMSRLGVHDVDTRGGFVRVNKGKGGRDRIVPMGRKASDYVAEYLRHVRSHWSKENRDERALWLTSKAPHKPLSVTMIERLVQVYAKEAGLSRLVSPHVWRHTCATHMVAGGANIAYVQKLLGHRSLRTTQLYTRVTVAEMHQTFDRAHPRQKVR